MSPHNGERSRTVATSAIRTLVMLAVDAGAPCAWACDRIVLGRDSLEFTVVGLRKRGTNPCFQLGRQRPAPLECPLSDERGQAAGGETIGAEAEGADPG